MIRATAGSPEIETDPVGDQVPLAPSGGRDAPGPLMEQVGYPGIVHHRAGHAQARGQPDRQVARLGGAAVGLDQRRGQAVALEPRGGACGVVEPGADSRGGDPVLEGETGYAAKERVFEDRGAVGLQHRPRRLARGFLEDLAPVRRGGVAANAGELQGA